MNNVLRANTSEEEDVGESFLCREWNRAFAVPSGRRARVTGGLGTGKELIRSTTPPSPERRRTVEGCEGDREEANSLIEEADWVVVRLYWPLDVVEGDDDGEETLSPKTSKRGESTAE